MAGNHGRAVGRTITGKGEPFSKIPIFWSARLYRSSCQLPYSTDAYRPFHHGTEGLRYCGLGGKGNYDDIFIKGNPSEGKVKITLPGFIPKR